MPISCTESNLRHKQHINGQNVAKQAYKFGAKIFRRYENHILSVYRVIFFTPPCRSERCGSRCQHYSR